MSEEKFEIRKINNKKELREFENSCGGIYETGKKECLLNIAVIYKKGKVIGSYYAKVDVIEHGNMTLRDLLSKCCNQL